MCRQRFTQTLQLSIRPYREFVTGQLKPAMLKLLDWLVVG